MDDLEELRRQLQEERQLRQAAETLASEERRGREAAETRAFEERRGREAAETRAFEERRGREAAETRASEERRGREAAEAVSAPTDLRTYIWNCHDLSLAIDVVTEPTETTKGETAKATRRYYPSQIIPWKGFTRQQSSIWEVFYKHSSFMSTKQFANSNQMDYIRGIIKPITAEMDLRYYERDTVENHVQSVVEKVYEDNVLRQEFQMVGPVTFESHTNLGVSNQRPTLEDKMQELSLGSNQTAGKIRKGKDIAREDTPLVGQADRFCVYRRGAEGNIPAIAIEYKAPHKLTCDEIITGLSGEIQPARDVIGKEENTSEFYSMRLVTVVITQLFSYMIGKNLQYGYVCTGEAFIFLHIPEDPSIAEYALCVPNQNVQAGCEEDLESTAVARVVSFTLQALASTSPSQKWRNTSKELGIWPVEYEQILEQTPREKRLKGRKALSPIYRGRKPDVPPFRMTLRSCRPTENRPNRSPTPPPPDSPSPASRARGRGSASLPTQTRGANSNRRGGRGRGGRGGAKQSTSSTINIRDRPYCSQKCLLGLRDGSYRDPLCPNFKDHCGKPIPSRDFRKLVRTQLAIDLGNDADCYPLHRSGSYGTLFKIRLSSHGFTFVAKGACYENWKLLLHEQKVYQKLRNIQGDHVPVCLGAITLDKKCPYYFQEGIYTHMILLSWAGAPITRRLTAEPQMHMMIRRSLQAIHNQGVLHGDAEPRNILWNDQCHRPMIVDFGRSSFKEPLGTISPNTMRKNPKDPKNKDPFILEQQTMQHGLESVGILENEIRLPRHYQDWVLGV
ncbi:hypothetical protein LOZ12_004231 [Ophidiomyces ophidiicola]|uniref:uncharacterized protein n=1 Tax=Ophidiomyces ophidiicola TaxID=1387563 RepID=UPI0020C2AC8B|nr:uncharacterized protein LOZ57_000530 [Ophidiomyces ophidiicola]KAI1954180.1 hypothetical protein LOZ57_000530 [Ophidiomyces ophidiicola]KAI1960042.1 hypothetical protein LOZ59_002857 [Ophidiomyces ophidiicola]KAI2056956.1 hypothetical protein LOZ43_003324 [Ophidiomyces ophidiicola]KAI2072711.1 hypothetical protein LOZ39_004228 [Ophidiomyces ophidiicola]KAI2078005.1 hypothetical protein LOZ37_002521 [Ophidiomyces ophidiicola]